MNKLFLITFVLCGQLLGGCRGGSATEPPIVPIRNMFTQPRYNAQSASNFYQDGRSMRTPVKGTVAREMPGSIEAATGRTADDGAWMLELPPTAFGRTPEDKRKFLDRGRERYNIYCAPCHAQTGAGDGMITRRAVQTGANWLARNLHEDAVKTMPDGQLFATISNGVSTMPAYKHSISVEDRWAIVAYVRALQADPGAQKAGARIAAARGGVQKKEPAHGQ